MIFKTLDSADYHGAVPEHQIEFRASFLRRERYELHGELRVWCGLAGARAFDDDGLISSSSMNFSSDSTRTQRAKALGERARTNGKVDWAAHLQAFCIAILNAEQKGRPGVILRDVAPSPPDDVYNVHGWKFPKRHLTITFGAGGTMKSYLLLWGLGSLAQAGVRVGFIDWELDAPDHSHREHRLFLQDRPAIHYLKCLASLPQELPRIQHWLREHQIQYVGLDSVAFGTPGKAEDSERVYNRAFMAMNIGANAIAHVRKDGQNPAEAEKYPFGSIFWHNSARCTWFVKEAESTAEGSTKTIGLYNRKMNLSAKLPAIGFAIDFEADRTRFSSVDVRDVSELAASLPLWQRIREVVRHGPQTIARIATELGHSNVESLDRIIRRQKNVFTKITGTDGVHRIALLDRRAS